MKRLVVCCFKTVLGNPFCLERLVSYFSLFNGTLVISPLLCCIPFRFPVCFCNNLSLLPFSYPFRFPLFAFPVQDPCKIFMLLCACLGQIEKYTLLLCHYLASSRAPTTIIYPPELQNRNNRALSTVLFDVRTTAQQFSNFKPGTRQTADGIPPKAVAICDPDLPLPLPNLLTFSKISSLVLIN